ncbi:MAG TPA: hypothetical protein VE570_05995, partial [Thermoleophilaceae bacterium]|nr:hypothetical protein [Thermoleophilaceae bacterium]
MNALRQPLPSLTWSANVERQETDDPWGGRQPKYGKLVARGPDRFFLATSLPSGGRILVRLGRVASRFGR